MEVTFDGEVGGRTLTIKTGKLAKQASGSVLVQYGDTMVLVTAVASNEVMAGADFLPLTVEYQEKGYAAGQIPGNYFRREVGKPSEKATLTSRLIDRPIRPLFPKHYKYETQVIATVLSADNEIDPDTLAVLGASAALEISDIPFAGPVACVRVGRVDGVLKCNPTRSELEISDINIVVAGSRDAIVMVEGGGQFVQEKDVLDAIFFGHDAMQPMLDLQQKLKEAVGRSKREVPVKEQDQEIVASVTEKALDGIKKAILVSAKQERRTALDEIKKGVLADLNHMERDAEIKEVFKGLERGAVRNMVVSTRRRIDGRALDDIRPIQSEVALLPRTHGSALFTRGETQALAIVTLGSTGDEQRVETSAGQVFMRFMLHYNFPPFCVGEVRRLSGPSRRDIGHGALATRAVEKILPAKEEFDYTVRVVSEVLESNGSSSMATVCASSLALMDAGVPVKMPVAGIAMGLIKEGDQIVVLSDILGDEDHIGDMDFKVAGTRDGITALQMDIKIDGLTRPIMEAALDQARKGRNHILDKMEETIQKSRPDISPFAPKIVTLQIKPDKIREVIGAGGKVIRAIQAETNTRIEVEESGLVKIVADSEENARRATQMVESIVQEAKIGAVYEGTVRRIMDFGAFVEIFPGTDGLVHISQLDVKRVAKVTDVLNEGDKVTVKVLEIDRDGKIRLSRRAVMEENNEG